MQHSREIGQNITDFYNSIILSILSTASNLNFPKSSRTHQKKRTNKPWYGHDCQVAKLYVRQNLKSCRASNFSQQHNHLTAKREYKNTLKNKKKSYYYAEINLALTNSKNLKTFCSTIKKR